MSGTVINLHGRVDAERNCERLARKDGLKFLILMIYQSALQFLHLNLGLRNECSIQINACVSVEQRKRRGIDRGRGEKCASVL